MHRDSFITQRTISRISTNGTSLPPENNKKDRGVPTVSFTAEGHKPSDISAAPGRQNIYLWDGHNYAIEPATQLGLMKTGSVVHVGLAHYDTMEEVDRAFEAVAGSLG